MKEFIDKLIEKIVNTPTKCLDTYSISCPDIITGIKNGIEYGCASRQNEIIDIVNQLAEEYKDKNIEDLYISRTEVLRLIEDIKCDDSIPKNYGTLLDIMREIRNMPTLPAPYTEGE